MDSMKGTRLIGKPVKATVTLAQGDQTVQGTLLGLHQSRQGLQALVEYQVTGEKARDRKVKRWVPADKVWA